MIYAAKIQGEANPALDPWIYRSSQADSHIWMSKRKKKKKKKKKKKMKGKKGEKTDKSC